MKGRKMAPTRVVAAVACADHNVAPPTGDTVVQGGKDLPGEGT